MRFYTIEFEGTICTPNGIYDWRTIYVILKRTIAKSETTEDFVSRCFVFDKVVVASKSEVGGVCFEVNICGLVGMIAYTTSSLDDREIGVKKIQSECTFPLSKCCGQCHEPSSCIKGKRHAPKSIIFLWLDYLIFVYNRIFVLYNDWGICIGCFNSVAYQTICDADMNRGSCVSVYAQVNETQNEGIF